MGVWGVIPARTCPSCPMTETLWWAITNGLRMEDATDRQLGVSHRIQAEAE